MIGVALALIAFGVVLPFFIPWRGLAVGIVGLILAVLSVAGVGRRAAHPRT